MSIGRPFDPLLFYHQNAREPFRNKVNTKSVMDDNTRLSVHEEVIYRNLYYSMLNFVVIINAGTQPKIFACACKLIGTCCACVEPHLEGGVYR